MYEDRQHVVHPRYLGYSWHIFYIYSLGTKDTCIVKLNHEHAKVKNRLGPKHSRVLVITFPKYIKTKQKQYHTALSFDIRLNVDMHTYIFSTSRISLDSYATQFMDFKWCLIEWPKASWASTEKKNWGTTVQTRELVGICSYSSHCYWLHVFFTFGFWELANN